MTYKESDIEAVPLVEVKLGTETLDGGIADVDAVQEGHHVDDKKDGKEDQIKLSEKPPLGLGVDWPIRCVRGPRFERRDACRARLGGLFLR